MAASFTPRMKQIVMALLEESGPLPIKLLAGRIHISKRTVQRELEYIPSALKKYDILFCSKTGAGVWLEGTQAAKSMLLQELKSDDSLDVSDKNERQKRLVLEILKDKKLKKLYYYSDLFGVSEATVSSDLNVVKDWFHKCHLEIQRKPGYGVFIEGSEKDFRRALRVFIDENIHSDMVQNMHEDRSQSVLAAIQDKNERNIYRVLDDDIVSRVIACIQRIRDRRILNLTQDSYLGLVIHVAIAVNRIRRQEIIEENTVMAKSLKGDHDYQLAEKITASLEDEFDISIPEIECAYICLHIKGSKIQQLDIDEQSKSEIEESRELWNVVNEMIDCYDEAIAHQLRQDEEFVIHGLIAHLKPTLVRLANGMKIQNPLLEQIKADYPAIFKRCRAVAKVIEAKYGFEVPEPEIGFLAIHFGAAEVRLESRKESRRKVSLGIVCASGIGLSQLMSSKINRDFGDRAESSAYGIADLSPYVLGKHDFFVSTIPLKEEADILYVSPLLPTEDMEEIGRMVRRYEYMPKRQKEQEFTVQLDQVNYVAVQIKTVIRTLQWQRVDNGIPFPELLVAISEKLTDYAQRREILQEALLQREKLGSQVYPDLGIALLHARTSGALKPGIAVFQTKDGGPFADPYFKGVCAALAMVAPKDGHEAANSEILGVLSGRLVEEGEFLMAVKNGSQETIRAFASKYLNQYFKEFLDKI